MVPRLPDVHKPPVQNIIRLNMLAAGMLADPALVDSFLDSISWIPPSLRRDGLVDQVLYKRRFQTCNAFVEYEYTNRKRLKMK
jgi:hypothetical protein